MPPPKAAANRRAPPAAATRAGAPKRPRAESSSGTSQSSQSESESEGETKRVDLNDDSEDASASASEQEESRGGEEEDSDASPVTASDDDSDSAQSRSEEEDDDSLGSESDAEDAELPENPALSTVGASKFASALRAIVGGQRAETDEAEEAAAAVQTATPDELFKRTTKMMKEARAERLERERAKLATLQRRSFDHKNVLVLPLAEPRAIARERELKRVATRGVVALFNAINAHQRSLAAPATTSETVESKDSFLEQLRQATASAAVPAAPAAPALAAKRVKTTDNFGGPAGGGWRALQDDYLDELEEEEEDDDDGAA